MPARASLLTGQNAIRNGVTDNGQWLRPDLAACGIRTWPELLAEAGYYTAAIGKMHFYPWDITHGFQYRSGAEDKRWLHVRDEYYHSCTRPAIANITATSTTATMTIGARSSTSCPGNSPSITSWVKRPVDFCATIATKRPLP
ncbi:MAG: sulfatase-like hydrolase/transferase [Caldilineaceae bacterium]|nr:sulfatase-like hydrolase/transferase [Caldilineaceae bacterium]